MPEISPSPSVNAPEKVAAYQWVGGPWVGGLHEGVFVRTRDINAIVFGGMEIAIACLGAKCRQLEDRCRQLEGLLEELADA